MQAAETQKPANAALTEAEEATISADAAQRSAIISEKQLQTSHRPWIVAQQFVVINGPQKPSEDDEYALAGNLTISNVGTSVASEGESEGWLLRGSDFAERSPHWACDIFDQEMVTATSYGSQAREVIVGKASDGTVDPPAGFLLAPGAKTEVSVVASQMKLEKRGPLVGIQLSTASEPDEFFVLGCTRYKDQLGILHHLQWCFQPSREAGETSQKSLLPCTEFIYTD